MRAWFSSNLIHSNFASLKISYTSVEEQQNLNGYPFPYFTNEFKKHFKGWKYILDNLVNIAATIICTELPLGVPGACTDKCETHL